MSNILKVKNPNDYSTYLGQSKQHPLVCIINYEEVSPIRHSLNYYSVYGLFLRDDADFALKYGCGKYDYNKGTLMCIAPGQIGGKEDNGERVSITGWALLFHPDLLHGTHLEKGINKYSFFDYRVNEALHLTDNEHDFYVTLMKQLRNEIEQNNDDIQDKIIVGYIELILDYCLRFYNRQFATRKLENSDILMKLNALLFSYFDNGLQLSLGLPSVKYCADKLCMSANYFGDLIRKTTGESASYIIRQYIIHLIENELSKGCSVTQAAYNLGFEYPQHLSRMYKTHTNNTPSDYIRKIRET